MDISKNKYIMLSFIVSFILFIIIFKWIDYLANNKYVEYFTSGKTSHTVDLPLTTTYSCKNFCGPASRCAITGQQCFADIDCPGCQPYTPPLSKSTECVPGENDSGKLTVGVTPQYSELTTDIGTQSKIITNNLFSKPPMANFGVNTWKSSFNTGTQLFNKRYKPSELQYMPNYSKRYSLTGEFIEDGPIASNAYLG
jgi:hypothetical protein